MSWNPDSGDPLSNPAINELSVEASAMKLWAEFLGGWFDGQQHMLRGALVDIPQVNGLTFQEMMLDGKDGLYLQVTTDQQASQKTRLWIDERWMVQEYVKINFWFRALVKSARTDGHNSISLVRWGADTLSSILSSKLLVAPLGRKGMTRFRPQPHKIVTGSTCAMRHLPMSICYTYSLEETVGAASPDTTVPIIESDIPAETVYIGAARTLRVTPLGFEKLGPDGNWYLVDVELLDGEDGIVPAVSVTLATDN